MCDVKLHFLLVKKKCLYNTCSCLLIFFMLKESVSKTNYIKISGPDISFESPVFIEALEGFSKFSANVRRKLGKAF